MKTLLVTGASSGIGRELALRAARAGYAVYAVGRNREALDALRARIEGEGGTVAVDATDISIAANAAPLIARALARFGSLAVLVNNAGYTSAGELIAQPDVELIRQFGTHVIGPIALAREARAALRDSHGQVFMVGSGVARIPLGGMGAYPPAKSAIRAATTILRRELRVDGIAVTYVDPGAVDTPFMQRAGMPGAPRAFLVRPEDVARKIIIAIVDRPGVLNAAPWQTTLVALAERFPRLTETLLARAPGLVGGAAAPAPATSVPLLSPQPESPPTVAPDGSPQSEPEAGVAPIAPPAPKPETGVAPTGPEPKPEAGGASIAPTAHKDAAPPASATLDSAAADDAASEPFAAALAPFARRMDKMSLRPTFVRELLAPGATLDAGEVALRWAGMPNKHERALTIDVLDALTDAGFLERASEQTYRVVRTAAAAG